VGSPVRGSEAETVCRHCLQILTAETINIWKFRTIHFLLVTSLFHGGELSHILRGGLVPQVHEWHRTDPNWHQYQSEISGLRHSSVDNNSAHILQESRLIYGTDKGSNGKGLISNSKGSRGRRDRYRAGWIWEGMSPLKNFFKIIIFHGNATFSAFSHVVEESLIPNLHLV